MAGFPSSTNLVFCLGVYYGLYLKHHNKAAHSETDRGSDRQPKPVIAILKLSEWLVVLLSSSDYQNHSIV
jgi:hypothetical protein